MLTIGICEDEYTQIKKLECILKEYLDSLEIEYGLLIFNSGEMILKSYPKNLDILFLDIKMNGISGIDTARKIRELDKRVEIVFLTTISTYVYDAFELKAYRYIIKPILGEQIRKTVSNYIKEQSLKEEKIIIKSKKKEIVINIEEILYIEVIRKETTIYINHDRLTVETPIKVFEERLRMKNFYRCHKSYIINLNKVTSILKNSAIVGGYEIPISKYRMKNFKYTLVSILGEQI